MRATRGVMIDYENSNFFQYIGKHKPLCVYYGRDDIIPEVTGWATKLTLSIWFWDGHGMWNKDKFI